MKTNKTDVLIIGGGPAGTTFGSLMKNHGWDVTLLEKQQHPRFHIGESLLPMNMPILERLGVLEAVQAIGVDKLGADFSAGNNGAGQSRRWITGRTGSRQRTGTEHNTVGKRASWWMPPAGIHFCRARMAGRGAIRSTQAPPCSGIFETSPEDPVQTRETSVFTGSIMAGSG
jgi:hypothetical protein